MSAYARLLRIPHVGVLLAATIVIRLPFAINGLAVILFLREIGESFATAGLVAGALALGSAVGAPAAARLVDRRGVGMLVPLAVLQAAAVLSIWALGAASAPAAALAGAGLVAGVAFPPAGAVLRARWPELVSDPTSLRAAFALDSVGIEVSFVTGPLLTALVVALAGPELALGLSAGLVIVGTLIFLARLPATLRSRSATTPEDRGLLGPLADPAIRIVALATLPVGFCIGAVEVALPAFSDARGTPALAGVLLALWSLASGIGGLAFGARQSTRGIVEMYLLIAALFPLTCLPLAIADSPLAMGVLAMLAGLPIAPLIASRNELVGTLASGSASAESFTWLLTALVTGLALGSAAAGTLVESEGWRVAVLAGCAVAALGGALAYARRGTLRPRPATG
jgi:MFS family permease